MARRIYTIETFIALRRYLTQSSTQASPDVSRCHTESTLILRGLDTEDLAFETTPSDVTGLANRMGALEAHRM